MEPSDPDAYVRETIRRAKSGDVEAGFEALRLCQCGLYLGKLSNALEIYLAERIADLLDGVRPDRALYIAKEPGKPSNPFPEWKDQLGAFAALLTQRNYKPQKIAVAMCDVRARIHDKSLENSDAHKIRVTYKSLQIIDAKILIHLAERYREILLEYPPLKK